MGDPLSSDKKFVKETAERSQTAVELGKLAQEKGSSEAVKEFASRVVDDHTKASEDLQQAAAGARIEVPSETPRKVKKAQEKLSKLSGAEFDREYAKIMLKDAKDNVKTFERQSEKGQVPELQEFASKTLPKMQEQQGAAEQLEANTKQTEAKSQPKSQQ